jgi:hypothetical protein
MIKVNGYELPVHVSHSQIGTYNSCGYKYWLQKALAVPEGQTWWLAGGVAVHEATEAYDRQLWEAEGR